jgi:Protein of unknown function (DUF3987)
MPSMKGVATLKRPVLSYRTLENWHSNNPCPPTGSDERLVHRWTLSAANACKLFNKTAAEAFDFIAGAVIGCGRTVSNREISETIQTAYNEIVTGVRKIKRQKIEYQPEALEARAGRVGPHVNAEWLEDFSPIPVKDCSPAKFLWHLYEPGERVFIGTIKNARKPSALYERDDFGDFECLNHLKDGHEGVWFLSNPVTSEPVFTEDVSEYFPNGEKWRTEDNVTAWRYMVIESDKAPSDLWIRMLVQRELKICAIYTSGARSIHALVRVDQPTKEDWDKFKDSVEAELVTLGACPGSLTAVRLTRLPGRMRNELGKTGMQKLLYLDPNADGTPIIKKHSQEKAMEDSIYYQEYAAEAERILGKDRFREFQALTDEQFEELLKELAGQADLVADETNKLDFPLHLAPEFLRRFCKELADYAKVPVSIPFLSTVSILSAALGRNLRIQSSPSRFAPGNLYALMFVSSGVAKSEIFRYVAKPLTDRHKKDRELYLSEVEPDLKARLALVEINLSRLESKAKKPGGKGLNNDDKKEFKDLMKEKAKLEQTMSPPEYFAEDYTIEALGQIFSRNGEQLAAISPEASKPIKNLKGLYKDGNCEDTIYNKAYSLEAGKVDRVNRKADEFHEPCMAITWLTQPDKIDEIFGDEGLVKGGLAPRFITLHESAEIQEISWDTKVVSPSILKEYEELWNTLFDAYRLGGECEPENEEDGFEDTPWRRKFIFRPVGTEKESGQMMFDHYNRLVALRNSSLQDVQQFPARWTENAWRLALVFHSIKHGKGAHLEYVEPDRARPRWALWIGLLMRRCRYLVAAAQRS